MVQVSKGRVSDCWHGGQLVQVLALTGVGVGATEPTAKRHVISVETLFRLEEY